MTATVNIGPHSRVPWRISDPQEVLVHTRLDEIYGTFRRSKIESKRFIERYALAKTRFDTDAAVEIVQECVSERAVELLIDRLLAANKPPRVVIPHPEFDGDQPGASIASDHPTNAIPFAFASYIAEQLGCSVDDDLYQIARPARTKMRHFPRFLWQPKFAGPVNPNFSYILLDDVSTLCGTLAALRSHIVANGGTVIAVSTLARTDGRNIPFPIAGDTLRALAKGYGDGLKDLWLQKVGHDPECLTEAEGRTLAQWFDSNCRDCGGGAGALQRLRDRLASAAAKAE